MAGQHPTRRQVLEGLLAGAAASSATGFCQWNWAFAEPTEQHHHATHPGTASVGKRTLYKPTFFNPHEYATVVVLAELILPGKPHSSVSPEAKSPVGRQPRVKAEDAGATDAGVSEFIDFMVSQDPQLQPGFRSGIQWMDTAAGGQGFAALTPANQTALLERIAYRKNYRDEDKPGQDFFWLMRRYTVHGFYTSRIGLESIDYPGLRFYAESPAVPQDDVFLKSLGV